MPNLPLLSDATLEVVDRVALFSFDRDDVRNALTGTALVDDLVRALTWANANSRLSVMILTGNGSAFSAGGNIKEMQSRSGLFAGSALEIQDSYRRGIQRMTLAIDQCELPLIAAVNGPAIGAGFDLACMCDLRIGSRLAVCGETFINLGIIPGDGGAWYLQRLLGYQRAAELTFTGRLLAADEALALGLFLEVTEPEQLLVRARELAGQIAAKPPLAVRMTKRLLRLAREHDLPETLKVSAAFQGLLHQTEDHLEAINAFLDKRPGSYRGC